MRHRTLLIVDDDRCWRNITAEYFTEFKYKVITAETCAAGLTMAHLHKPGCILLDYYLPDDEGCVFAAAIHGNPELKKTPIIMVSGDESQELRAHNEYMLDGFALKDATMPQLKAKVESLLRRVNVERGIVMLNDLRLDGQNLQVYRNSKLVTRLTPEQFRLLALLLEKTPAFVSEDEIARHVFSEKEVGEKSDAIRGLAQRLRCNLGAQLGRRVKARSGKGWIYVQPRANKL